METLIFILVALATLAVAAVTEAMVGRLPVLDHDRRASPWPITPAGMQAGCH
jgi:hypothetical protein